MFSPGDKVRIRQKQLSKSPALQKYLELLGVPFETLELISLKDNDSGWVLVANIKRRYRVQIPSWALDAQQ